jgi:hypothetical protein
LGNDSKMNPLVKLSLMIAGLILKHHLINQISNNTSFVPEEVKKKKNKKCPIH